MSEFDRARILAERQKAKREQRPILTLPKQKGKSNVIDVSVWVNGEEFKSSFTAKITGNIMASQITENSIREIIKQALQSKLTGVQ